MTAFQAIILGLIQGLTEFIPVSSTAHLKVIPSLLGWSDPGAAFTAVIQWGTLVAALFYFRDDVWRLTRAFVDGLRTGRPWGTPDARLAWMIIVGTVPVVVCGVLFKKRIETEWRSLYVIAQAAIYLSLALAAAELAAWWRQRSGTKLKDMAGLGWIDALVVGGAQAVALVPGASRSGVTITGGLFTGLTRETAARFSFLLSLPAVFGAGVLELYKERHELLASQQDVANLVIASVVAGVVGYATIAFLLTYLKRHSTYLFITYRLALGLLLLVLLAKGVLEP
jgi:undecaprenyl-diphosphatase